MADREELERWCEVMHDAYEKAAAEAGWQTQERSRVPWAEVPEANKITMRAAIAAVEPLIRAVEREQVFDLVIDKHGSAFIHPDLLPLWEGWLSKIRADERNRIAAAIRADKITDATYRDSIYRSSVLDRAAVIAEEGGR